MNEKEQEAAKVEARRPKMDWQQVALNAPAQPCFAVLDEWPDKCCGRAHYRGGHDSHRAFVSLDDLLDSQHSRLPADGWREINGVEDLPKEDGRYLVTVDDDSVDEPTVFIAQLKGEDFVTDDHYEADIGSVVAWMPWPDAYQQGPPLDPLCGECGYRGHTSESNTCSLSVDQTPLEEAAWEFYGKHSPVADVRLPKLLVDFYSHYKRITPPPTEKEER